MIPKIIHYCWMSKDPYPEKIQKCIDSWKKYLPDYEFINWNYDRFPRGMSKWVDQAFDSHKYAFAADYLRLYALYNYGGIYLDTDVEVLKPLDDFLLLKSIICWEKEHVGPEVAAFGVEKFSPWIKICLEQFDNKSFILDDGSFDMLPLPKRILACLQKSQYNFQDVCCIDDAAKIVNNMLIPILPADFFSPKSYVSGELKITENTYTIHHFAGTWLKSRKRLLMEKIFGFKTCEMIDNFRKKING